MLIVRRLAPVGRILQLPQAFLTLLRPCLLPAAGHYANHYMTAYDAPPMTVPVLVLAPTQQQGLTGVGLLQECAQDPPLVATLLTALVVPALLAPARLHLRVEYQAADLAFVAALAVCSCASRCLQFALALIFLWKV